MKDAITVETYVNAPIGKVWDDFTDPESIKVWNAASPDWHTTEARNDLRVGGEFSSRMEAKDGSEGFDFTGTYTSVVIHEHIAYTMEDPTSPEASKGHGGRKVDISFAPDEDGVRITETFEPEAENTHELQRAGWHAILDNFKKYVESSSEA